MEKNYNEKNIKLYSVLAYIGILWIIGLLVPEKNDEKLRFHVGQGMLLFIISAASGIITRIIGNICQIIIETLDMHIFASLGLFGASMISIAVSIFCFILMIIGIMNAANDKKEELPVIGKYAFFK